MAEFRMPSLGADMDAGTVTRWLVKPGDLVHRGDIVAEVETNKATIEVEIFESGVVDELLVPEGERVPVGTPLARLRAEGAAAAAPETAAVPVAAGVAPVVAAAVPAPAALVAAAVPLAPGGNGAAAAVPSPPPPVGASPLARRLAAILDVDLAAVTGTGPGGAVTRGDVQNAAGERAVVAAPVAAAAAPPVAPAAAETVPPAPPHAVVPAAAPGAAAPDAAAARRLAMREAIGALMARSKREIPHYYLGHHVNVSAAQAWLTEANLDRPIADRLVVAVLFLKAVALAVHEVPEMNGFWVDGGFRPASGVHLGVAVSLRDGGLIAPAIHDVDEKALDELMGDLRGLVQRARAGTLRSSEMSDPTLTVTNLGDQGVETVYGVIYAPQVALVGFGRVLERPWASEGMVGARPVVHVTLAADHRVSDGHRGGRFLAAIDHLLQEPDKL